MKYIAVFCSSQNVDEKYAKDVREFGNLIAKNGYGLVWGGSDVGLMKVIADAVEEGGGRLYGVSTDKFHHLVRKNVKDMMLVKNLGERKAAMLEKSDIVVALVGGIGTLDELADIAALRKIKAHKKSIVILNTDNFYEGLKMQLKRMEKEGFLASRLGPIEGELVHFSKTPKEAIEYINRELK